MQYEMNVIPESFNNIQNGFKTIEVRLNDDKRQKLKKGDKIVFYKLPETIESTIVDVKEITYFDNFHQLYSSYDAKCFGFEEISVEKLCEKSYEFYSKEQEKTHGVVAIKIKLL
ncbi:MAG: ASCH domain-containing protein [Oscillospiraceae bacterium]